MVFAITSGLKKTASNICKSGIWMLLFVVLLICNPHNLRAQNLSLTPSKTVGCAPLQISFANQSSGYVSYKWDFGDGNTSFVTNPTNVYTIDGSFDVRLIGFNGNGGSDTLHLNQLIQVYSAPSVQFSSSLNSVCQGSGVVNFINSTVGADAYLWDFGDGATSTMTTPNHIYSQSGSFGVTLIGINTIAGCTTVVNHQNFINVLPGATGVIGSDIVSTCAMDTGITFSLQGSNATNLLWSFGDGNSSVLNNPTHTYGSPGTFSVQCIATNLYGCVDTISSVGHVVIKNNPNPDIVSTKGIQGCVPLKSDFFTNVDSVSTYLWSLSNGITSTSPVLYGNFNTSGIYSLSLNVIYDNGCANSAVMDSIIVHSSPSAYYIVNNISGCAPLTVDFTDLSSGVGLTYNWNFGDGSGSALQSPSHTYSTGGIYQSSLEVVNQNGCKSYYSYPKSIEVNDISGTITADDLFGCKPHTVNFSTNASLGLNYTWDFGDGNSSNLHSPSHTYLNNGIYNVSLVVSDNSGCVDTIIKSNYIHVNLGSNNFNNPDTVYACSPFTIDLKDNSINTVAWNWDFGDGNGSSSYNPNHTYTSPGVYTVSLSTQTNGSSCSQYVNPYSTYVISGGEANFDVSQTVCPPYTGTFTDLSVNAVSWYWEFGDGSSSTLQNPVHVYNTGGSYNVSLTITTADGCTYTSIHNYAVTFLPLSANPIAITTDTVLPMTVHFTANSSGATGWLWEFGDGSTSTQQNPVHTYTTPGPYDILLTLFNSGCSYTYTYNGATFGSGPIQFGSPPDSLNVPEPVYSCVPYEFSFANPLLNTVSWHWDFGDGDTSNVENPTHIYTEPGIYDVILIGWDQNGVPDTVYNESMIYLNGPQAAFEISTNNTCNGPIVTLTDSSSNAATYHWDFGDGNNSSLAEPVHQYSQSGSNYNISLTVTDSAGCSDYMSQSYYSSSASNISASKRKLCAPDTVHFTGVNLNYANYLWVFGDGDSSANISPYHIYTIAGTYSPYLVVIDSLGCNDTLYLPYQIKVISPQADFQYTPTMVGCSHLNVQFNNISSSATDYLWMFGDSTFSTVPSPSHSYVDPGYYDITLIANNNGCSDTLVLSNAFYLPDPIAGFTYQKNSDCYPVTVSFTDTSYDAVDWFWDFGDGTTSNLQHPVKTYSKKPIGNISLTVTDIYGCKNTISVLPFTAMEIDFVIDDTLGCKPFTLSVSDSSSMISAISWDLGDGNQLSANSFTHVYQSTGIYQLSVTATSLSGCTQTINNYATISVMGPTADFSTNNPGNCAPTTVFFTDASISATDYNWNFGDGSFSTLKDPTHIYSIPGNYDISLIVSDSSGCSDTLTKNSHIHVTGVIADFDDSLGDGCAPYTINVADSSINASTWQWSFGDGSVSSISNPSHTYQDPGSYIVSLFATDTSGCTSYHISSDTVHVYEKPLLDFQLAATNGCAPHSLNIFNNSSNYSSLLWEFGDGTTSGSQFPSHVYNNSGTYLITLYGINTFGCSDSITYPVPVVVNDPPSASFNVDESSGCSPLSVSFINTSTGTDPLATYQWSFSSGATSILHSPTISFTDPGYHSATLIVTNSTGCSDTANSGNPILVFDTLAPPVTMLRSVSVMDEAQIEVIWSSSQINDFKNYDIYRKDGVQGSWNLIHTIYSQGNTSWNATVSLTDTVPATSIRSYSYKIITEDACDQSVSVTEADRHSSLDISAEAVGSYVDVFWDKYDGCAVGLYEIYRADDQNYAFTMVGVVDGSENRYRDSTIYCSQFVTYRILAKDLCGNGFEAWSDTAHVISNGYLSGQSVELTYATVKNDEYIFIEWEVPGILPGLVTGYELYRSTDSINYNLITILPPGDIFYEDYDVDVHNQPYYYKVKVINVCDIDLSSWNHGSSIYLNSELDQNNRSVLRWTPYSMWGNGVDYYIIEKQDPNGFWNRIGTVDGKTLKFLD